MKKTFYRITSVILLVLWLVLIFGMSARTGEESAGLSIKLAELVNHLPGTKNIMQFDTLHTLIRKCAHFTEYGILALLIINFMNTFETMHRRILEMQIRGMWTVTSVFCMIYASLDEYHQSFVDGRGPSVRDVCIDTAGAVVFLAVLWAILRFKKSRRDIE